MRKRKYTDAWVSKEINCTSSQNYSATAKLGTTPGRCITVYFSLEMRDGFTERAYLNLPKYAIEMIMNRLRELHAAGELKVFEYNRDGAKRYENLRYHDAESLASYLE